GVLGAAAAALRLALGPGCFRRIGAFPPLVFIALDARLRLAAALRLLGLRFLLLILVVLLAVLLGLGLLSLVVRAAVLLLTGLVRIGGLVLLHVAGVFAFLVLGVLLRGLLFARLGVGATGF